MHIRPAQLADIDALCNLDHGYVTDHVWQLSGRDTPGEYLAQFRLSRLPRQIQVPFGQDVRYLRRTLHRCDHVWVMQGDESDNQILPGSVSYANGARGVLGYIGMATLPWQNTGWVPVLNVVPEWRRKGIGTQLLRAAMAQAKADGLHSITLDIQTKNYPATRLCQARGFRFAGYSDNFYQTHDIALFFAYKIR
jgi:ribosomal protein S18 acetylase RimI-like enzyme